MWTSLKKGLIARNTISVQASSYNISKISMNFYTSDSSYHIVIKLQNLTDSMYKLSWMLENSKKLKVDFFSKQITFQATKWLMMTVKVSATDMCDLSPIQTQERVVMQHVFLRLLHRKCMGKFLSGCKCCTKQLNKEVLKYFYWVKEYNKWTKFQDLVLLYP